jgi:hypothetical protein
MTKERKIVGFPQQVLIILWKNLMLMSKNKLGTVCELLLAALFVATMIGMNFLYLPDFRRDDPRLVPNINKNELNITQNFYFYPNNSYVQGLVKDTYIILNAYYTTIFNQSLDLLLVGTNKLTTNDLSESEKQNYFAMVAFPSNYTTAADIPDTVEYTLFPKQ